MKVIAELSVIPVGVGVSFSKYIAECENILQNKGLTTQLHAEGTNIEGEFNEVLNAIKRCIKSVHQLGAPRIITDIRLSTRIDKPETMDDKIHSVEDKM